VGVVQTNQPQPCFAATHLNEYIVTPQAKAALVEIPMGFRTLVIENAEQDAKEKGLSAVSMESFMNLAREYGMDQEFMDRFKEV
jgi:hypothetical protein